MSVYDEESGTINWDSVWNAKSDFQDDDAQKPEGILQDNFGTGKFSSYSGADISATVHFYDETAEEGKKSRIKKLADLQTLTYSVHREKFPVRALGHVGAKGYTRGPRTIGGTMIFTIFDKSVLWDMMVDNYSPEQSAQDNIGAFNAVLVDQIPPFDITVLFANELGSLSRLNIYGVELVNEGQTMSIEDLMTESVCNYVARHIQPMVSLNDTTLPYLREGKDLPNISFNSISQNKKYAALLSSLR